jgi:hypothetical protein
MDCVSVIVIGMPCLTHHATPGEIIFSISATFEAPKRSPGFGSALARRRGRQREENQQHQPASSTGHPSVGHLFSPLRLFAVGSRWKIDPRTLFTLPSHKIFRSFNLISVRSGRLLSQPRCSPSRRDACGGSGPGCAAPRRLRGLHGRRNGGFDDSAAAAE